MRVAERESINSPGCYLYHNNKHVHTKNYTCKNAFNRSLFYDAFSDKMIDFPTCISSFFYDDEVKNNVILPLTLQQNTLKLTRYFIGVLSYHSKYKFIAAFNSEAACGHRQLEVEAVLSELQMGNNFKFESCSV